MHREAGVADTRPGAIPNQRTNPDSESRVVESDLESESDS